jgi:hypothetical protein
MLRRSWRQMPLHLLRRTWSSSSRVKRRQRPVVQRRVLRRQAHRRRTQLLQGGCSSSRCCWYTSHLLILLHVLKYTHDSLLTDCLWPCSRALRELTSTQDATLAPEAEGTPAADTEAEAVAAEASSTEVPAEVR